jgi:hypothetical protein
MKKNIIKFITVVAVLASVSAFAQSNTKVLVKVFSAAPPAALNTLTYGKFQGFSADEKAFVVIPNDDNATTLANLENELKAIAPTTTTTKPVKVSAPKARTNVPAVRAARVNTAAPAATQPQPAKVAAPVQKNKYPVLNGYNLGKVGDKATTKPNADVAPAKVVAPSAAKQEPAKVAAPVVKPSDARPKDKVGITGAPVKATAPH